MRPIRNTAKAATILSDFVFESTGYHRVEICFRGSWGISPSVVSIDTEKDGNIRAWGKDEWKAFILEQVETHVSNFGRNAKPVCVDSLRIIRSEHGKNIYVEMTNIESGLFDRILFRSNRCRLKEVYLEKSESLRIRGIREAKKAYRRTLWLRRKNRVNSYMATIVRYRSCHPFMWTRTNLATRTYVTAIDYGTKVFVTCGRY